MQASEYRSSTDNKQSEILKDRAQLNPSMDHPSAALKLASMEESTGEPNSACKDGNSRPLRNQTAAEQPAKYDLLTVVRQQCHC
jgi:hypothetical protein